MLESSADRASLGRFYTKPNIGRTLVALMGLDCPQRVVDLGAGRGCLSIAASHQWQTAEIFTIDIDKSTSEHLETNFASITPKRHTHFNLDALCPNLPKTVIGGDQGFDVAICNPPYLKPEWRPGFEQILDAAGLIGAFGSQKDITPDAVFLAQNIRLTKQGGRVGLILPDGVITGMRYRELRRSLLAQHQIECVVQLPRHSFCGTDAQAYILFFHNAARPIGSVKLMSYSSEAGLSRPLFIDRDAAYERMDYTYYHCELQGIGSVTFTLAEIGAEVTRGVINSAEAKAASYPVFHTSNFPAEAGAGVSLSPSGASRRAPGTLLARAGDILLARVDRSLHRKITYVTAGEATLSDCVYRIRVAPSEQARVMQALSSDRGSGLLESASRGVSARMLAKRDLMRLQLPVIPTP